MFFQTNNFRTLEAGVNMTQLQQQMHLQNLANIETPGYKSKELVFEKVLEDAQSAGSASPRFHGEMVTDDSTSIRQDGNNVNYEKENIELYKSYTQYSMLIDKVSGQFDNYNYILNNNMK